MILRQNQEERSFRDLNRERWRMALNKARAWDGSGMPPTPPFPALELVGARRTNEFLSAAWRGAMDEWGRIMARHRGPTSLVRVWRLPLRMDRTCDEIAMQFRVTGLAQGEDPTAQDGIPQQLSTVRVGTVVYRVDLVRVERVIDHSTVDVVCWCSKAGPFLCFA